MELTTLFLLFYNYITRCILCTCAGMAVLNKKRRVLAQKMFATSYNEAESYYSYKDNIEIPVTVGYTWNKTLRYQNSSL